MQNHMQTGHLHYTWDVNLQYLMGLGMIDYSNAMQENDLQTKVIKQERGLYRHLEKVKQKPLC